MPNQLFLHHGLPQLSYGTVSVWVYDPGFAPIGGGQFGNYFGLYVSSPTNGLNIQTFDWDESKYHYQLHDTSFDTTVSRTRAWHQFVIQSTASTLTMSIDGVTVYSGPGNMPFDTVRIGTYGGVPDAAPHLDDFQISATSVDESLAPRLSIEVSEVRLCWNSLSNRTYQIQYRSPPDANSWINLGEPIPGNGIVKCITDPVVGPRRFYQVLLLP
jgi:hypothetical protein